MSLRLETSQPLQATYCNVWSTLQQQQQQILKSLLVSFKRLSGIACISICAHCFSSCHWAPLKRAWLSLLYFLHQVFTHTDKTPACMSLPFRRLKKPTKIFNHLEAAVITLYKYIYINIFHCKYTYNQTFWKTLCIQNTYWWTPSTSQSFPTSLGVMFCRVLGQISINLQRSDQPICKTKMQPR